MKTPSPYNSPGLSEVNAEAVNAETFEVSGEMDCQGQQRVNVTEVDAANYSLLQDDYILHVTYTSTGAVAILVPEAQCIARRVFYIKDAGRNAATNHITVTVEGGRTIDGKTQYILDTDNELAGFYCDGVNLNLL